VRLDERDVELIEMRVTKSIEESRPRFADALAKVLVPLITTAVVAVLTQQYPPDQYGEKAKGGIDWQLFWTTVLSWASIGVIGFILLTVFFYVKAHL